ncbi:HAMP domain-containing protein, partial [Candidatus Aerophobetes bacterium]|nr:HAMP domain-containing protein [Candidatus Aerophobetes bacterium]
LDDRGSKIGIWVIVPLEKFNEIIGMMQASYLLDLNFIEELKRITTADISLFTRKKLSLTTLPELSLTTLPSESFSLKPELLNEMLIKRRKLVDNIVITDESYKIGLTPLLKKDGTFLGMIMASLPKKGMISLASEARNRLLMIGCLGVFLALLVGYLIAEYLISRPISKLAKGAAAISRGDLNQEIIIDTQDEIGVLASTFNEMRKKLREAKQLEEQLQRSKKLAALGEMSAGVAHEIRNPLGVIKSSAQMLRDEFKPVEGKEEYHELNTFIIEEVNRLNRVITEFLSFARPTPPDLQRVNINEIIDKTLRLIASEEKVTPDVKIKVESNKNLPLVMADPEQIVQALLDIALNGLQAMSDGGELRIAAKRAEDAEGKYPASLVQIQITDTGEGIPPSIRDKIFNPFFTTKEEGSGLGLAIVHKIIENHKGFIEVESEVGKGTAFKIFLPLTA